MCGLAGYSGLTLHPYDRIDLVEALGLSVESRGRHASGFAGYDGRRNNVQRVIGPWSSASWEFIFAAATNETLMMHARYATCGDKGDKSHAHPFTPIRDNRPVLYGMHNGMVYDARESAEKNGRRYTVDSRELFELIADGEYDSVSKLHGYGTLSWMTPHSEVVRLCRMTPDADLSVVHVRNDDGSLGTMWASTYRILKDAAEATGLTISEGVSPPVGEVWGVYRGKCKTMSPAVQEPIRLASRYRVSTPASSNYPAETRTIDGRLFFRNEKRDGWYRWEKQPDGTYGRTLVKDEPDDDITDNWWWERWAQ